MNVFVVFSRRLATLLYILYILDGGGGGGGGGVAEARRAPGARQTARSNFTDQNTKSNLI